MFYGSLIFSQTILVDDINYSSQALVDILLSNSCSTNSNISISSNQSVAYFNGNNSIFPIQEGIIIRSGIASYTQGTYTGNLLDSQVTTNGDNDLQNISNQSGQTSTITDAAYLKFDFVPNLQSGMYIPGTGFNQCINGNPVHITPKTHITFFDPNNYEVESVSNCYSSRHYNENGEPTNKYLMDKCYTN